MVGHILGLGVARFGAKPAGLAHFFQDCPELCSIGFHFFVERHFPWSKGQAFVCLVSLEISIVKVPYLGFQGVHFMLVVAGGMLQEKVDDMVQLCLMMTEGNDGRYVVGRDVVGVTLDNQHSANGNNSWQNAQCDDGCKSE